MFCKHMPDERFSRTELIFGKDNLDKLRCAKVAVFGVGGVGGYAVEALARSSIGRLDLFDSDKICLSNFNRQIHATAKTLGQYKVDAAKERIADINPDTIVNTHKIFYLPETSQQVDLSQYDYVIDAIDTVAGKIELIVKAAQCSVPVISSMGAGNKINITDFEVADIYSTSVCPLAKVMRHELRKRGIEKLKVVYSKEPVIPLNANVQTLSTENSANTDTGVQNLPRRRQIPGSNAFVPAAVGLIIAGEVVKDLMNFYHYLPE